MNNFEEFDSDPKKTNYKKWGFKVFIYIILLNILVAYMVFQGNYHPLAIFACSVLATLLLMLGIVLTIMSIKNKEEKNYQYYVSIWGYSIFVILTAISILNSLPKI